MDESLSKSKDDQDAMIYNPRTPGSEPSDTYGYDWAVIYLDKSASTLTIVISAARSMWASYTGLS